MKDLALQKPFLQTIETTSPQAKNYYAMRKLIGDYLTKLNVASYDTCCAPSENYNWPVRWSSDFDRIERFDGTEWVEVPTGGASGFTPASVIFADGSGDLTDDGSTFSYNTSTNTLTVNNINIGRGSANQIESLAIGNNAGTGLVAGALNNTFIGFNAGNAITTGDSNVGIGWKAIESSSGGNFSNITAIGQQAVNIASTSGVTAIGAAAAGLYGGTQNSVFIGVLSGYQAITDNAHAVDGNVGIGHSSLYKVNCTGGGLNGRNNVAIGYLSAYGLTTGQGNVHIGINSGGAGTGTGSFNIAIGQNSRYSLSGANYNIAIGNSTLQSVQTGSDYNIALGQSAGSSITTGSYNVVIGGNNGASIATSSNNILISDGQGNLKLTIDSSHIFTLTNGLQEFADDAAAAVGGIPINGLYRTASVVKIRVV